MSFGHWAHISGGDKHDPLSHLFATRAQHGDAAEKKTSLLGDFKRSSGNPRPRLYDTSIPKNLGAMFAMERAIALDWPYVTLMLTIVDFAHAYKHIGLDQESKRFAAISLAAPDGPVMMAYLNKQPFPPAGPRRTWVARRNSLFFFTDGLSYTVRRLCR